MAVTADSVVVELIAKTDGYTAAINGAANASTAGMSKIEQSAARAEAQVQKSAGGMGASVGRAANDIEKGSARAANASRNLGRQISDIGVGVAGGQSPFLIIAQQAPQVADALADTGGKAAQVATFFAGPWGAALLAAGSALGVLLGKALETGDSVDDLVKKLTDQARKAEVSAQADRVFAKTQAGLAVRVRETTDALNAQNASLRTNAQLRNVEARQQVAEAENNVRKANDRVTEARRNAQQAFGQGGTRGDVAAERAIAASAKAAKDVQDAQRVARQANIDLNRSRVFLAAENAAADATETGRIGRIYDDRINAVKRAAVAEANAGKQVGRATQDRILALEREKAAAIDAASTRARAAGGDIRSVGGRRVRATPLGSATSEVMTASDLLANLNRELAESTSRLDRLFISGREYTQNVQRQFRDVFGQEGEDYDNPFADVAVYDRQLAERREADRRKQEDDIYALANIYEQAFSGGTRGFLDEFKREGLRVVALLVAQLTLGKSFSSALGSSTEGSIFKALGGLFGRASGGYVAPGQTVRVNEGTGRTELLRMGGQGGTVIPLGQTKASQRGGGTTIVQQSFNLDARYGITTPELLQYVNDTARTEGRRGGAAAVVANARATPGTLAQYDKLEG